MENEKDFRVPTTLRTGFVKPKIKPGFYAAKLLTVKIRDKEGNFYRKENTKFAGFANQAILEFGIYKKTDEENPANETVTEPVTVTENNIQRDFTLAQFINWRYGKQVSGETVYTSALGPDTVAAKTFKALGWAGPQAEKEELQMLDYVGKWVTVIVDDYTSKNSEDKTVFSIIKDMKPFTGKVPAVYETRKEGVEKIQAKEENVVETGANKAAEYLAKLNTAKKQLSEEMITQRGYDTLVKSLKAEYGVLE